MAKNEKPSPEETGATAQSNNKLLFWILGGCLALLVIGGLILAGIAYWSYKKVKKEAERYQPQIEQYQEQMEQLRQETQPYQEEYPSSFSEEPPSASSGSSDPGVLPENTERQIGYIKKFYEKNGKRYLEIDYIQWFTGDAAEKAMREDGECYSDEECIVFNDYYIRNVNPLIRTFEIEPAVEIRMQTYNAGNVAADISWNELITYAELKGIFSSAGYSHLKDVPYIVEIQNQKIMKITEQYIP